MFYVDSSHQHENEEEEDEEEEVAFPNFSRSFIQTFSLSIISLSSVVIVVWEQGSSSRLLWIHCQVH